MTTELDRAHLERASDDTAALNSDPQSNRLSNRSLSAMIVTYKSHELLEQCLASLVEHAPQLPVYVYENSGDQYPGREELAARHPDVHWVLGPVNLGFGAAFNALVKHAPDDTDLLVLNADTRLTGPLTRTRELVREPDVAAVSPLIQDPGAPGPQRWDIATRHRTLARSLVAAAGYSDKLRGTRISHLYREQPAESQSIDGYMAGICLAINRVAWNEIGGFDEEFFLYGEETDWQERATAAGWRILLADELNADHGNPTATKAAVRESAWAHGAEVSTVERFRNRDLLRSNIALLLERQDGVHHADVFLAATSLMDRVQRSKRHIRKQALTARAANRTAKPSIVITTNRLVYGGAERQKALLAAELDRRGYAVTVVCMQRFGPLLKEIPHSVRVVRQPWWAPMVDLPEGPAVLITGDTNTETGFATLWKAAGSATPGHRRWLVAPHVPPENNQPIYSRPLAAAMRRADGLIALSQRHWDMLTPHHKLTGRHFVAPNGVAVSGQPTQRVRTAGDPPHLVMLSRIVEHKNPHLLVEALSGLTSLPWRLSIFGDGPDRERLEARTPDSLRDRIQWCGWSPGPGPALADADLLCVPSRSEAFPLVILEAMARGVPVAASGICAVPEMLDFGKAGFVVEPVSVSAWRNQLAEILADPDALPEVGQRGLQRMQTHYTVEAMTDAYLEAIDAVM